VGAPWGGAARSGRLGPWLLGSVLLLLCVRKKTAGRKEKIREGKENKKERKKRKGKNDKFF
jgi:hypothetical protein